jgi:hypothetical protein
MPIRTYLNNVYFKDYMKNKLAFWLILVGIIVGIVYSIWIINGLIESQKILSSVSYVDPSVFPDFEFYTQVGMISSWIFVILGFILLILIGINLNKIYKKPNRRNYKFIIIFSIIGIFTSIFYGAIVMLIGSVIGYKSIKP